MRKIGVSKRSFSQPSALSIVHREVSTREVQALALLMTSVLLTGVSRHTPSPIH